MNDGWQFDVVHGKSRRARVVIDFSERVQGKNIVKVGAQIRPFPAFDMSVAKRKVGAAGVATGGLLINRHRRPTRTDHRFDDGDIRVIATRGKLVHVAVDFWTSDITDQPDLAGSLDGAEFTAALLVASRVQEVTNNSIGGVAGIFQGTVSLTRRVVIGDGAGINVRILDRRAAPDIVGLSTARQIITLVEISEPPIGCAGKKAFLV